MWPFAPLTKWRLLAAAIDVFVILLAYYLALALRFDAQIPRQYAVFGSSFWIFAAFAVVVHIGVNRFFRVYRIVARYVGLVQALWIVQATLVSIPVLLAVSALWPGSGRLMPLTVILIGGVAAGMGMVALRFYSRILQVRSLANVSPEKRMLIVGAGQAAEMILREIDRNRQLGVHVVGLVDDNPDLHQMRIHNHPVLGAIADTARLAGESDASEILLAIPSATSEQVERIYGKVKEAGLPLHTLPFMSDIIDGRVTLADVRTLDIEDLLGRPPVETDVDSLSGLFEGVTVMVTGAAGSIGSEICRQVTTFRPRLILMVDRDESALYELHEELRSRGFSAYRLAPSSILDRRKMEKLIREHRPHVVFHAAAFKHVPLMELAPDEAVLNNITGTQIIADLSGRLGVERFVNISTDKAVDPVSVMGATKRAGEYVVRHLSERHPATRFVSVRFGNVLGSQGSVIPVFRRQIEQGGPLTITHPDMTRFFMSIGEAVQLVLQAAAMAGTVLLDCEAESPADGSPSVEGARLSAALPNYGAFILEMGGPVRIVDLARRMIEFAADGHGPDIEIEYTGLRPGEKLHETLVGRGETTLDTAHPMIKMACVVENSPGSYSVPFEEGSPRLKAGPAATAHGAEADDGDRASDVAGAADISALLDPHGLPLNFEENLARAVMLAERHASRQSLIEALMDIVPSYRPFDWGSAESLPGVADAECGQSLLSAGSAKGADRTPETSSHSVVESRLDWAALVGTRLALELERSAEAILITDEASRIKYVNPAYERLFGRTTAEVLQHHASEFMGADGEHMRELIRAGVDAHGAFTARLRAPHKDGVLIDIQATFSPLRDRRGRVVGAACVAEAVDGGGSASPGEVSFKP
jgi:PAS domain S-box-containing protein